MYIHVHVYTCTCNISSKYTCIMNSLKDQKEVLSQSK